MTRLVEINIPFPGFYNSLYSDLVDREVESWSEYEASDRQSEEGWPEQLIISERDLSDMAFYAMDYSAAYRQVAEVYLSCFDELCGEAFGFTRMRKHQMGNRRINTMQLAWSDMTSPKEYNFETDRVFAFVPLYLMRRLFAMSRKDGHETLTRVIGSRFTSRSGFISFYSSHISDWLEKPLDAWDHNELGALLIACLEITGTDYGDSDLGLYYRVSDYETGYNAFSEGMDWPKLESDMRDKRKELLAEWLESDPESCKAWAAWNAERFVSLCGDKPDIPYRCDKTPDLFANA